MTVNEAQANDVASASFVQARFFLFILINLRFWVYGLFCGGFLNRRPRDIKHRRAAESKLKMRRAGLASNFARFSWLHAGLAFG